MRNYAEEFKKRVAFLRTTLQESGCKGFVFGNSGGKDSALVGTICKAACDNTIGVIMPCGTTVNYGSDTEDALRLAEQAGIETRTVDITPVRDAAMESLRGLTELNNAAVTNMAPRLRMMTLYSFAAAENLLVAGTNDAHMALAANTLIECGGGMCAVADGKVLALLPLPIAGLMNDLPVHEMAELVEKLDAAWKEMGCVIASPYMTMALVPLACLPELRLTNRGLVDCRTFRFVDLFC